MAERVVGFRIEIDGTDQQARKLSALEVELSKVTKERNELLKVQKEGNKLSKEEQQQLDELTREQQRLRTEKSKTTQEVKRQNKEIEATANSYDALVARNAKLRKEINRLPINDASGKLAELKAEFRANTDQLKEFDAELGQNFRNVGNYSSALDGLEGILNKVAPGLGNISGQLSGLTQNLQGGSSGFAGIGAAASAAFAPAAIVAGIGAATVALVDLQQELEETRKQVSLLTGLEGEFLDQVTANVQATADVFDQDFNEVLRATNSLAKQLGIGFNEATDLINKGFALGADLNGEFLDTLKEYPAQFKNVGISAEESISIITQSVQQGIFSDKGVDAIKEAGIRLRELTPATREALDGIGLSSDAIAESLRNGEQSIFDVVQSVSRQLGTLPAQSAQVGTAIADIFGGAGEDAGLEYIKTLANINTSLDEVIEGSSNFVKTQLELVEAERRIEKVFNDVLGGADGLIDNLNAGFKTLVADGLEAAVNGVIAFINGFRNLQNESIVFRGIINGLTTLITTNFKIIRTGIEAAIIEPFKTGGELIQAVFTGQFSRIPDILKSGFNSAVDVVKDGATEIGNDFVEAWQETVSPTEILKPISLTDGFLMAGSQAGSSFGTAFLNATKQALTSDIGFLEALTAQGILTQEDFERQLQEQRQLSGEAEEERLNNALEARLARGQKELDEYRRQREEEVAAFKKSEAEKRQEFIKTFNASQAIAAQIGGEIGAILSDQTKTVEEQNKAIARSVITTLLKLAKQQAIIAATNATVGSLASPQSVATGGTAGIAQAAVLTALIEAAFTALEAQVSKSFAVGGIIPGRGGFIRGNSHANGGVKFMAGGRLNEAEGGEIILNKNVSKYPHLVRLASDINASTGGAKFQSGGIVTARNTPPSIAAISGQTQLSADELALKLGQVVNDKQVFVTETDISGTQATVEENESLGIF